jgi:ketosteroid isomerase-like protein
VSEENVELVRRGYAAWNRGDVEAVVGTMGPQVELHGHGQLPEPGPHVGPEAAKRWFENLGDAWESISVHPVAFGEAGDNVIAVVSFSGRGRGSGVEIRSGLDAHIWTVEGGSVVRLVWLQGDEAARRADLSPQEVEVLRLRGELEMSDAEIASHLGLSGREVVSIAEGALAKIPKLAEAGGL